MTQYKNKTFLLVAIILICPFCKLLAQSVPDSTPSKVYPLRIHEDFDIDENLTNPLWEQAKPVYISHEFTPDDQAPAPVQTRVKVLYSNNNLYIGFWAKDPNPSQIRAHMNGRDQIGFDDFVDVTIDPFNTHQYGYELAVNPLGVQLDAKYTPYGENFDFDMLWYSKGAISDSGYTVVIKVPFESLHFPDDNVQNWTINFLRIYPRSHRYQLSWADLSIDNPCQICQAGHLVGITDLKSSNPVDIIPYAMGFKNSSLNDPGNPASGLNSHPVDGRIGGTITYSPSSTSSLDVTINPDFSQVETDAIQISANKTFAIQYDEKRPFFLKRSNLFQTGYDLFYSRTINRPLTAAKFSQTSSDYSIAFLTAYDRNTPFIIPGLLESTTVKTDVNAYDNILRGKYNLGPQSYIGGLVTTRNTADAHNYVGSVDWKFFLGHHLYFSGNAAYSDTKELSDTALFNDSRRFGQSRYDAAFNGEQYGGTLLNAEFKRSAKYSNFTFRYASFSPTFQAQNGFMTQNDRRQYEFSQEIDYYPGKVWLAQGELHMDGIWRYDFANVFRERHIEIKWINHFAGQTVLSVSYLPLNDEQFRGRFFTKLNQTTIDLKSRPTKFLFFGINLQTGRDIYRIADPKLGHGYRLSATATLKPVPKLRLDLDYSYSTLSSLDDHQTFYCGSISRLEGRYQVSRRLYFRLIGQYNSFDKRIQVYPLLAYKLNPFTKIYVGMTDYMKQVTRLGPPRINEYRQTNREFFVKIQYLFRR